jgi:hypothetical protein
MKLNPNRNLARSAPSTQIPSERLRQENCHFSPLPPPPPKILQLSNLTKGRKYVCAGLQVPVAEDLREVEDEASEQGQHATCQISSKIEVADGISNSRYALIVGKRIQPGRQCLSESIFV